MAQWVRICLPVQGTRVQPLLLEDAWVYAHAPQVLSLRLGARALGPVPHSRRSLAEERPVLHSWSRVTAAQAGGRSRRKAQRPHSHKQVNQQHYNSDSLSEFHYFLPPVIYIMINGGEGVGRILKIALNLKQLMISSGRQKNLKRHKTRYDWC